MIGAWRAHGRDPSQVRQSKTRNLLERLRDRDDQVLLFARDLALVGTVMSRSASRKVLLRDGDGILGTYRRWPGVMAYQCRMPASARMRTG
jgi:hypothetical protein